MSAHQMQLWYRPVDLCMLSAGENTTTQDHKTKVCKSPNRLMAGFCGPGMGTRYACPAPLNNRLYFSQGLVGFDDASQTPLRRAVEELTSSNATLIFVGDSLMMQNFHAFLCELEREKVKFTHRNVDDMCHQVVEVFSVQVHYLRIGRLQTLTLCKHNKERNPNKVGTWPYVKSETEKLQRKFSSALLVVNIGVWYNLQHTYNQDLQEFLPWLENVASRGNGKSSAIFLETAPSHWNTANGYIASNKDNVRRLSVVDAAFVTSSFRTCCYAVRNLTFEADWRNYILHREVAQLGLKRVSVLPLADSLRHAKDMHACPAAEDVRKWDCTHYCFWPTQLQYVWHTIAVVAATRCIGRNCDISTKV